MTPEEYQNWENMEKKRLEQYYNSLNKTNNWQSLNETQNLNKKQNDWQSLNEINDLKKYNQYENLNDGLGMDFDFEVRVNGVVQNKKQNHPYHQKQTSYPFDIKLNEDKPLNEVIKNDNPNYVKMEEKTYTDNTEMDILEWFNKVSNKAMLDIYENYKNGSKK